MTTATKMGWWRFFLAAAAAALVALFGAGTASAATLSVVETRVGASTPTASVVVGPHECITAGQHWVPGPSQLRPMSGHCVAANSGADTRALLASIGQEGKTAGVLNIDGELTPLVSGRSSLSNYAASGHVEGQAALIMREQGVSKAELLIDNPNGICGYCTSQVPTLLPEGAELTVRTPLGTVPPSSRWFNGRTFLGNAADPKGW